MLVLENIVKEYVTGDTTVRALDDVTLAFRKNEFVSILGHSGCGKTTMLNIIGGLDRYTSGVMSIKGVSTEKYKDSDWDAYRNHSIGFVFQSYNLIPHQTVLSNVELALTLSGVSSAERKRRAKEVLAKVGLADQMHKKPNQMSGGQMQRVAIARALINDPEILLADEPTGALDTETSVQIMDILKEISSDKLIIMVTHNPELAEQYSDRIIRLSDGHVVGDTAPYSLDEAMAAEAVEPENEELTTDEPKKAKKKPKKPSMSFLTALSLSLNNLLTKKTRTFMTSFAGSIGIIGIALILSLSNGITAYINKVQRDTLSSYPITIQKEEVDMSSMIASLMGSGGNSQNTGLNDKVYVSTVTYDLMQSMLNPETSTNNLVDFKKYLETDGRIKDLASLIRYGYDIDINAYVVNGTNYVKSDIAAMYEEMAGSMGMTSGAASSLTSSFSSSGMTVWQEMLPPEAGSDELVHGMIKEQYDLVAGKWPEKKNDVMLVVTGNNEISDMTLYSLGLASAETMMETMIAAMKGETVEMPEKMSYEYDELIGIKYKVIPTSAYYKQNEDGEWINIAESDKDALRYVVGAGLDCEIVGIIRQNEQTSSGVLSGTLVYTSALTDYLIDETAKSEIVKAQLANPDTDIFTGLPFDLDDEDKIADDQKAAALNEYLNSVSDTKKAEMYRKILTTPTDKYVEDTLSTYLSMTGISETSTLDELKAFVKSQLTEGVDEAMLDMYLNSFDNASDLYAYIEEMMVEMIKTQYAEQAGKLISDIENTPSAAELDAEMVREIIKLMPIASQRILLKTMLTSEMGEQAATAMVAGLSDAQVFQTLDSMIKMYGASGENKSLYSLVGSMVNAQSRKDYIVALYVSRTGLSETVIRNEVDAMHTANWMEFYKLFDSEIEKQARANYASNVAPTQSQAALDKKVAAAFMSEITGYTDAQLIEIYDTYVPTVSSSTFTDNCELLGIANKDDPSSISIYAKNFEDKQRISDLISEYNAAQTDDNNKISYTDYVGMLFSSITKIIDAISYVLIFFVSISLVVSSIMIGIITYISVLERTKEIGILRAMGASKRDVSRVFNAETLIVGFVSGMIGIIVTVLLNIPIGIIIKHLSDISGIASLPIGGAIILVAISMALTLTAGLIPSRIAAKKDPVEALRTE